MEIEKNGTKGFFKNKLYLLRPVAFAEEFRGKEDL